ncbi:hypothetical protein HKI87_02g11780 [Chloropicon roscoffensis]|uniref:Uncharacterized protein n=1 Tax=Chloropicon roscoffensis TaxID=1461544 RepID=A0AAX4P078_9CHLO
MADPTEHLQQLLMELQRQKRREEEVRQAQADLNVQAYLFQLQQIQQQQQAQLMHMVLSQLPAGGISSPQAPYPLVEAQLRGLLAQHDRQQMLGLPSGFLASAPQQTTPPSPSPPKSEPHGSSNCGGTSEPRYAWLSEQGPLVRQQVRDTLSSSLGSEQQRLEIERKVEAMAMKKAVEYRRKTLAEAAKADPVSQPPRKVGRPPKRKFIPPPAAVEPRPPQPSVTPEPPARAQQAQQPGAVRRSARAVKEVRHFAALTDDEKYFCGRPGLNRVRNRGGEEAGGGFKAPDRKRPALATRDARVPRAAAAAVAEIAMAGESLTSELLAACGIPERRGKQGGLRKAGYELGLGDLAHLGLLLAGSGAAGRNVAGMAALVADLRSWFEGPGRAAVKQMAAVTMPDFLAEREWESRLEHILRTDDRFQALGSGRYGLSGGPQAAAPRVPAAMDANKGVLLRAGSHALERWNGLGIPAVGPQNDRVPRVEAGASTGPKPKILSHEERTELLTWLPEADRRLLGQGEVGARAFFSQPQIIAARTRYQELLREGLLQEGSNAAWIPSSVARKAGKVKGEQVVLTMPQLGKVVYGQTRIADKLLGLP